MFVPNAKKLGVSAVTDKTITHPGRISSLQRTHGVTLSFFKCGKTNTQAMLAAV